MQHKYLVILMTALNPSSKLITSFGEKRLKQYILGFERIFELSQQYPEFDFVVVDNTITPDWRMDNELKAKLDQIPNLKTIFFFDNSMAERNKGCGVLISLRKVFQTLDMSQYDYCIYFEPRMLLLNFEFFKDFLQNPRSIFKIDKFRVTAKTKPWYIQLPLKFFPLYRKQLNVGLYSLKTDDYKKYLDDADLEYLADKKVSLEDDMYEKLKGKNISAVKTLGILWHNAYENVYIAY